VAGVDGGEDQRGHDHAAHRGQHRQRSSTRVAQVAVDELALDLEPDQQEEERHQRVVHPVPQGQVVEVDGLTDADGGVRLPQGLVGRVPGRVRPRQRDDGGGHQDDAAGRLHLHEPQGGADERTGDEAVGLAPGARVVFGLHWSYSK
jgi:hypothetical protein